MDESRQSPRHIPLPANLRVLEVTCHRCGRYDRLDVSKLAARYGSEMPLAELLSMLSAKCPREPFEVWHVPCGAHFVGLAKFARRHRRRRTLAQDVSDRQFRRASASPGK